MKKFIAALILAVCLSFGITASGTGTTPYFPTPNYYALTADFISGPNGPNISPINPTLWYLSDGSGLPGADQLEVLSNVATTTCSVQCDGQQMNVTVLPESQWLAVTIQRLTANGVIFLYANGSKTNIAPAYRLTVVGPSGTSNAATFSIDQLGSTGGTITYTWASNVATTVYNDSQIALVVDHTANTIAFWRDGVLVDSYTLSASGVNLTGSYAGLQLASGSTPATNSDVGVVCYLSGGITTP
jgi:hypothetical protein